MDDDDEFLTVIGRMILEMDMAITPSFEADRILLGGRIACLQQYEDNIGTEESYFFLTDMEPP